MLHDIRYALREFRRTPAFTVTGILVLAIGIGANSAVFSVVNTMLLKTLTVPEQDRVVQLMRRNQPFNLYCVGASDLKVWGEQTRILEDVTGYSYVPDQINLDRGRCFGGNHSGTCFPALLPFIRRPHVASDIRRW